MNKYKLIHILHNKVPLEKVDEECVTCEVIDKRDICLPPITCLDNLEPDGINWHNVSNNIQLVGFELLGMAFIQSQIN